MALPTGSDNKWPKLFMEEVANDGSATTTPAADHRAFFVGEDGLFHLKDSSGTVTTPGVQAGAATSSGLTMATARLLGRTTASTGAIEEITVGSGLSMAAGTITATGGSFDPDTMLPWHVSIVPMVWTPDAATGTWAPTSIAVVGAVFPFYTTGSAANSGAAVSLTSSGAQNDAVAWDVILAAGTWDAHFWVMKSTNTGIITLNQDGASQGTVDTYAAASAAAKVSITGFTVATTGKKRMQILAATKNASSSDYFIVVFGVEFRRTA